MLLAFYFYGWPGPPVVVFHGPRKGRLHVHPARLPRVTAGVPRAHPTTTRPSLSRRTDADAADPDPGSQQPERERERLIRTRSWVASTVWAKSSCLHSSCHVYPSKKSKLDTRMLPIICNSMYTYKREKERERALFPGWWWWSMDQAPKTSPDPALQPPGSALFFF